MSDLSELFCVRCLDICLCAYGIAKVLDYFKCVKNRIKNGFHNNGFKQTFVTTRNGKKLKYFN